MTLRDLERSADAWIGSSRLRRTLYWWIVLLAAGWLMLVFTLGWRLGNRVAWWPWGQ